VTGWTVTGWTVTGLQNLERCFPSPSIFRRRRRRRRKKS